MSGWAFVAGKLRTGVQRLEASPFRLSSSASSPLGIRIRVLGFGCFVPVLFRCSGHLLPAGSIRYS